MLQLKNICKSYTTGDFTQVALNDVSISFRDNEVRGDSGRRRARARRRF